jgi:hypothetical protein
MSKAFLSDRTARGDESLWQALDARPDAFVFVRAAAIAVDEARRILAETEPDADARIGWRSSSWYDSLKIHPCDAIERHILRDALAESLRAFVEGE